MGGVLHDVEDRHVRAIISDAYDPAKSYAVGDYCIRDNTLYKCIEETTDVWNSTSWEATNVGNEFVGVTNSLNARLISNISPTTNIYLRHYVFGGNLVAGEIVKLGGIISHIPEGYALLGVLLTPRANVHVAMSWLPDAEYSIYAYSETASVTFNYDALLILTR